MKIAIRLIICTVFLAIAVTMAAFTVSNLMDKPGVPTEGLYVLGEVGGNVAVFGADDLKNPISVTDIEVRSLRSADRALIQNGLISATQEEISSLLEDLGS